MLAQVTIITNKANDIANPFDVKAAAPLVRRCQRFGSLRKRRTIAKTKTSKMKVDGSHIIVSSERSLQLRRPRRHTLCSRRVHAQVPNKIPSKFINENLFLPPELELSPTKFCWNRGFMLSKSNSERPHLEAQALL